VVKKTKNVAIKTVPINMPIANTEGILFINPNYYLSDPRRYFSPYLTIIFVGHQTFLGLNSSIQYS
jgi:hypothetical protein